MSREHAPDWILQQALAHQRQANQSWVSTKPDLDDGGLTLTVLGCGTMGIAILSGILESLQGSNPDKFSEQPPPTPGADTPTDPFPQRLPTRFNCCVRRHQSSKRVKSELGKYNAKLQVYENDNLEAVKQADVVLLCCKPQMIEDILQQQGIREALAGKLLISICAGIPETRIHDLLYSAQSTDVEKCFVVRAMPNTAAAVRESMTVIATPTPPLSTEMHSLVTWIFTRIGRVTCLPAANMDACTALCGSGPAFVSLMLESLAAGAIAMGIPREEAYSISAQMMRGTTGLILQGEHPAILRDKVSTPGGCTIGGLGVLEEGMVRGTVAKAVRAATLVASQLGKSKQDAHGDK